MDFLLIVKIFILFDLKDSFKEGDILICLHKLSYKFILVLLIFININNKENKNKCIYLITQIFVIFLY